MARPKKNPTPPTLTEWVKPAKLALIKAYRVDGASLNDVANLIGVGRSTLYKWKAQEPKIEQALSMGKMEAVALVENRFFENALVSNKPTDQLAWLRYNKRDKYFDEQPRAPKSDNVDSQLNALLDKIATELYR